MPLLEELSQTATTAERLLQAAERINATLRGDTGVELSRYALRPEQVGVYADFASYITDVASRNPSKEYEPPMGRIILPPRTGKTVIAGQIIAGCRLMSTFIVPTKTLVEQAAKSLRDQMPGVPVGVYYGDGKNLAVGGVNVTTYQILQKRIVAGKELPWQIRHSALIFADEAHRAMTPPRRKMLREGFDELAIRVALTATPEYNEERTLATDFPDLIHEIAVGEAVELGLLASLRWWMYEVDEDASHVEIVAGNLQSDQIGDLMSAAPFFQQTLLTRYQPDNINRAALICCASRKQAYALYRYLRDRRPAGTPVPELILSETPRDRRQTILDQYETGKIDTLINVGILIEGWSSERCKLLIDLDPNLSLVRAEQKFFRPMTKWGSEEAHIHILVPRYLPQMPVLPTEFFNWPSETYEAGSLIGPRQANNNREQSDLQPYKRTSPSEIEKVELVSRIRIMGRFEKPKLDPRSLDQIRAVLESNPDFRPSEGLTGIRQFKWLLFTHPLFTGRGEQLLRFLGISLIGPGFMTLMSNLYPEGAGRRMLTQSNIEVDSGSCYADAVYMHEQLVAPRKPTDPWWPHPRFSLGWEALLGASRYEPTDFDPEALYTRDEIARRVRAILITLPPYHERVIRRLYGIGYFAPLTAKEVADEFEVSDYRIREIEAKVLRHLRQPNRAKRLKSYIED